MEVMEDNRFYMAHLRDENNYNKSTPQGHLNLERGVIENRSVCAKIKLQLVIWLKIVKSYMWQ
jgi:hypothetical protein